ncbi:ergosterol biosynthesis protein-like protein Erg28 [Xylariaceae sp. FL0255]|nr:ergosterol biosynthesis protein-like protein Erg28 [Xylariaceae sp. FL0255]
MSSNGWLPQHDGYLPYFLLLPATVAVIHSVVCYLIPPSISMKAFSGPNAPPANGVLARVYGVKNIYTGAIRFYAAYHISNPQVYDLAMLTFAGVLFLYGAELFVYKTSRFREVSEPFLMSGSTLIWMLNQRSWYTSGV